MDNQDATGRTTDEDQYLRAGNVLLFRLSKLEKSGKGHTCYFSGAFLVSIFSGCIRKRIKRVPEVNA